MIVSPATENVLGDADFTTVIAGDWMAVMVAVGRGGDDGRADAAGHPGRWRCW